MHHNISPIALLMLIALIAHPSYAKISDIQKHEKIIRNQQQIQQEKNRKKEFDKIQQQRKQLLPQKTIDHHTLRADKATNNNCFTIKTIEFIGAKALSQRQKQQISASFRGKCFDRPILNKIMEKINNIYQSRGFTTTQIAMPPQNVKTGNIKLEIIEGRIADIIVNDNKFTDKMQRFTAFGFIIGDRLNINDINQAIYQINRLSTNNAQMRIEPIKDKIGYSQIIITNNKTKKIPISANVSYDNLGSEFTGIRRTNISTIIDNLFFINDQIDLSYNNNFDDPSNQKDLRSFSGGISIPFAYNSLSYNYSRTKYHGQNQESEEILKLSGYSNSTNIGIETILVNNNKYRIATNLSLTAKETTSYINDSKLETSQKKLTIGKLSFAISRYFNNNINLYLKPSYTQGLKILNANKDRQELTTDIPKAQFQLLKLYIKLSQKLQIPKINTYLALSTEIDSQLSQDTLFGSEQFSIGGYSSIRGFRENNLNGDHGYYAKNEASFNLGQILNPILTIKTGDNFISKNAQHLYKINLTAFYDYGYIKLKYSNDSGRLSSAGLKTTFNSKYFDASLSYSWGIGKSNLLDSQYKENKMLYFEFKGKYF